MEKLHAAEERAMTARGLEMQTETLARVDAALRAIEAGTFVTPEVAPGHTFRIRVRVWTAPGSQRGSQLTRLLTFTSESNSNAQDAVQLKVTRI